MTADQINTILTNKGVDNNTWLEVEKYFPIIEFIHDIRIYTYDNNMRVRFNDTYELIELVNGNIENGIFVADNGETEDFTPMNYFTYASCHGLISNATKTSIGNYEQIRF